MDYCDKCNLKFDPDHGGCDCGTAGHWNDSAVKLCFPNERDTKSFLGELESLADMLEAATEDVIVDTHGREHSPHLWEIVLRRKVLEMRKHTS